MTPCFCVVEVYVGTNKQHYNAEEHNSGIVRLFEPSKSPRQCSLSYLLTYCAVSKLFAYSEYRVLSHACERVLSCVLSLYVRSLNSI